MEPPCQYTALRVQHNCCDDYGDEYPVDLIYRKMHGTQDQNCVLYTTLFYPPVRGVNFHLQFSTDTLSLDGVPGRVREITVVSEAFWGLGLDTERGLRKALREVHQYVMTGALPATRTPETTEIAKILGLQSLYKALLAMS